MPELDITSSFVTLNNQGLEIKAFLAKPSGAGSWPGVIVFQEIFGVNAHIRDVTERIARLGYVAIAPAIYQRQVDDFEIGYTPDDVVLGRKYKVLTKAEELLSDTQTAIAYLQSLPEVNGDALGAIGFCFGGHVTYLAATLPEIKAAASFYGAGIATMTPGGGEPTVTRSGDIQGRLYAFFGTEDASIPQREVQLIKDTLQQAKVDHKIFSYPAGHGFFCDQRGSYHSQAAEDAWKHVQSLFREVLS